MTTAEPSERVVKERASSSGERVKKIANRLANEHHATDTALLRRGGPSASFFRICNDFDLVRDPFDGWQQRESAWLVILPAMATTASLHDARQRLGQALSIGQLSEGRLNKLLRASGDTLDSEVRSVVQRLARARVPFDQQELAELVLTDRLCAATDKRHERARLRVARSFFRKPAKNSSTENEPKED